MYESSNSCFLLSLPSSIRWEIYLYLGFKHPRMIHLNGSDPISIGEWSAQRQCFNRLLNPDFRFNCHNCGFMYCYMCNVRLANQLFYVSRAVSHDARAAFFSQNRFGVSSDRYLGLTPVKAFTPTAWQSIRYLDVSLNSHIRKGPSEHQPCHDAIGEKAKEVIDKKLQLEIDWVDICCQMAAHTKADQIELYLGWDVSDDTMAEKLLSPLLRLPYLRDCSIRAGPLYDKERMQGLVEHVVKQITRQERHRDTVAFPFLKLPSEIQLQILEHTNLITPLHLLWIPPRVFVLKKCAPQTCEACRYGIVYSHSHHAAYSSANCCWKTPTPLLQVSHLIRCHAQSIFFSRNKFHLKATRPSFYLLRAPGTPGAPGPLHFLTPFPQNCLKHLRYLKWEFDAEVRKLGLLPGEEQHASWLNTLDSLARNATVHQLTLVMDMTWEARELSFDIDSSRADGEIDNANSSYYRGIVEPISRLKGLKNLFIHLTWPIGPDNNEIRDQREQKLERMVMGEDYDSFSRGKERTRMTVYTRTRDLSTGFPTATPLLGLQSARAYT